MDSSLICKLFAHPSILFKELRACTLISLVILDLPLCVKSKPDTSFKIIKCMVMKHTKFVVSLEQVNSITLRNSVINLNCLLLEFTTTLTLRNIFITKF